MADFDISVVDLRWDSPKREFAHFGLVTPGYGLHVRGWRYYPLSADRAARIFPPSYRAKKGYYWRLAFLGDELERMLLALLADMLDKGQVSSPTSKGRFIPAAGEFVPSPTAPWASYRSPSYTPARNAESVLATMHQEIHSARSRIPTRKSRLSRR